MSPFLIINKPIKIAAKKTICAKFFPVMRISFKRTAIIMSKMSTKRSRTIIMEDILNLSACRLNEPIPDVVFGWVVEVPDSLVVVF